MKKFLMGTGLGVGVTTIVATAISFGVVRTVKKTAESENNRLAKDLEDTNKECAKIQTRLGELESLIIQNKEMMEQSKKDRVELDREKEKLYKDKENVELEKEKISEAKKTILDGVDALKSAMYCNDIMTRDRLVEKNCEQITVTVQKINREMEFYKKFAGYGKDFAWVEGNVEAITKRLEDKPGDLEATMQLLGYEDREKQILRWCFAG